MKRVLVLMSTYNGDKYLKEQIDSIFNQKDVDVELLVRDDGSKDRTIKIINEYQKHYKNIQLIEGENCRSARSFMKLMHEANSSYDDYDYYAFCDQDDVWKPNKLIEAVKILSEATNTEPSLYLGSYQMVDDKLNDIVTPRRNPSLTLPSAIVSNVATGCTMVFNKALLKLVASRNPYDIIMHDYWVYLVCLCFNGFVYYDNVPYILYRQHSNNVIGGKGDSFFKRWTVRLKKLFLVGDKYKSKLADNLLTCYGDEIDKENKKFLYYVSTSNKWSSKYHLLKNPNFRGESVDKNLQTIGLVLTGKF